MANNIDDILTRLDEIKKLQAELRHLVPRVASNSPRADIEDSTSDKSALIRFPSLFTFPGVSSFTSPSAKNERVQKSTARLNLSSKLSLSDNQPSTASATWRPTKSSVKEMNVFRDSSKNANGIVSKSYAKNSIISNASTSATNSARTTQSLLKSNTANRIPKHLQGAIKKGLNNEIASADKKSHTTLEKSNFGSKNENNPKAISSSVQISDVPVCGGMAAESQETRCYLKRNSHRDRNVVLRCTLIGKVMKKLNYCFVDNKRVIVPHYYPGSRTPRRVHVQRASGSKNETLQVTCPQRKLLSTDDVTPAKINQT